MDMKGVVLCAVFFAVFAAGNAFFQAAVEVLREETAGTAR